MGKLISKIFDEIRRLRMANADMRERDFARIHGISEAELVAAFCGEGVIRLNVDVPAFLGGLPAIGEVMALTRNESAVHEKIGPYEKAMNGKHASLVLGAQIDLRIFPRKWASGFVVEKKADDGAIRRSFQFFDAAGDAVHKVHMRPASDIDAYRALVDKLAADEQSHQISIEPVLPSDTPKNDAEAAGFDELRERWSKLTDTHQFVGMLKKLNLSRHQAMHLIDQEYAWRLDLGATMEMLQVAIATELPIMAFVGNKGCIQIHGGPIYSAKPMGPWINIMDPTFHLHLRNDHITELWAVRKPTADGHVTSVEAYGADKQIIIQFFGLRDEGHDERPQWRELVESLPLLSQTHAA